jgi:hypothetical protein
MALSCKTGGRSLIQIGCEKLHCGEACGPIALFLRGHWAKSARQTAHQGRDNNRYGLSFPVEDGWIAGVDLVRPSSAGDVVEQLQAVVSAHITRLAHWAEADIYNPSDFAFLGESLYGVVL